MNSNFNKMMADIIGKMDEKVLQAKLNAAIDMLKKGDTEELVKKINKMDKDELVEKLNEVDDSKLKGLNLDRDQLKQQISKADLDQIKAMIGDRGDEIVKKIKEILG